MNGDTDGVMQDSDSDDGMWVLARRDTSTHSFGRPRVVTEGSVELLIEGSGSRAAEVAFPRRASRHGVRTPCFPRVPNREGVRMTGVPNKPKTPIRGIRVPDDLWRDAQAVAKARGEDVSAEVRAGLERYVKRNRSLIGGDHE